jgi:hypothetical protein
METDTERSFPSTHRIGPRPQWFRTGESILEAVRDVQGKTRFYRVNLNTGLFELLLPGSAFDIRTAIALAPDDRTVYGVAGDGPSTYNRLVSIDLETGRQRTVHAFEERAFIIAHALSADGMKLAATVILSGGAKAQVELWEIDMHNNSNRVIYGPVSSEALFGPALIAWSHDGQGVFFARQPPQSVATRGPSGSRFELCRVAAANPGAVQCTVIAGRDLRHASFHPSGARVAYVAGKHIEAELWRLDGVTGSLRSPVE